MLLSPISKLFTNTWKDKYHSDHPSKKDDYPGYFDRVYSRNINTLFIQVNYAYQASCITLFTEKIVVTYQGIPSADNTLDWIWGIKH